MFAGGRRRVGNPGSAAAGRAADPPVRDLPRSPGSERRGPRTCGRVARPAGPSPLRRERAVSDRRVFRSERRRSISAFLRPSSAARAGGPSFSASRVSWSRAIRSPGSTATRRSSSRRSGLISPRCEESHALKRWSWAGRRFGRGHVRQGLSHDVDPVGGHSPVQPGTPDRNIVRPASQAGVEPPLCLVEGARSDRQVRSTEPDAIIVGGEPGGMVEIGADVLDRVGLEGKNDV